MPGRTLVGAVAGAVGVTLAVLTASARLDPVGVAAGLAATTCMAFGVALTKRWGRPVSLLAMTSWQLTAGGLVLLPLAVVVEGLPSSLTAANLGGYAYLSVVGTAVAYALWFRGVERLAVWPARPTSLARSGHNGAN